MQITNQSQAATPATQATPAPASITTVGADGQNQTISLPRSRSEVRALASEREALSDQLNNVSARRSELALEIRNTADETSRVGLQDRLRVLDQRIIQLENDLATTGRQIASAPPELLSGAIDRNQGPDNFDEGVAAGGFTTLFFSAVAFLFIRRRWRRKLRGVPARVDSDSALRLERLEQGMDAIAIEIERVSEGQRFVTKLLSEAQASIPTGQRIPQTATGTRKGLE